MEILKKYFPKLTEKKLAQYEALIPLYEEWNQKINVISRKDIENLKERHILHSLAIARLVQFKPGATILDIGTGGGFPGIPLAIFYPGVKFHLIDGTAKKIRVVQEIVDALGLKNVKAEQVRAEELKGKRYDFVVCRAVAALEKLTAWSQRLLKYQHQHGLPNGLITLKGGDLKDEIAALGKGHYVEQYKLTDFFKIRSFEEKYIVYVQGE